MAVSGRMMMEEGGGPPMLGVDHGTPLIIRASSPLICLGGVCDHGLACHWLPPPLCCPYSPCVRVSARPDTDGWSCPTLHRHREEEEGNKSPHKTSPAWHHCPLEVSCLLIDPASLLHFGNTFQALRLFGYGVSLRSGRVSRIQTPPPDL